MNKSVYSLVLMDSVVEQIDREAYRLGTSRSNLINRILAEHLSVPTPETRTKEIFSEIQALLTAADALQLQAPPSDAMMLLRSVLRVKYNPTARYSVELYKNAEPALGLLKVAFRTQSSELLAELNRFFLFWMQLERHYGAQGRSWGESAGRFCHEFPAVADAHRASRVIARYIGAFDSAMKLWFAGAGAEQIENIYRKEVYEYERTEMHTENH